MSGCGGKGKPAAPKAGQAALLGSYDGKTTVGQVLAAGHPNGAVTDSAGNTYVVNSPSLAELSATGKGTAVPSLASYYGATQPEGIVAMPDGSVLFGNGAEVVRLDPETGESSVLAGSSDRVRAYGASAPATATADDVRFTKAVIPVGVTSAGAVVIADDRAVWSLASGRLTRVGQQPAVPGKDTSFLENGNAVAPDGTTYLRGTRSSPASLATVRALSPQGVATTLTLPASIPGVSGRPADLTPTWLAPDGGDGVYVHAVSDKGNGDYVLHLHGSTATLVASATPTGDNAPKGEGCDVHSPVDAEHFPCALPSTVSYHAGQLVLAGEESYVVKLPVGQG
ncbi:NHL repeat-containing protein [Actinacidiphila yeochonensis]|uniref:hypothetical protein n=1 Tax=Actinacidiphila yeochonensis TaxID=89050 RepID=UPI000B077DC2|nr:hypothetical protein [Actinacidiphila yeochonensis]